MDTWKLNGTNYYIGLNKVTYFSDFLFIYNREMKEKKKPCISSFQQKQLFLIIQVAWTVI